MMSFLVQIRESIHASEVRSVYLQLVQQQPPSFMEDTQL
jgi:hypothetical protein